MNKLPRVIFLESQEGVESLFTRGLRSGATAAGWTAELVFLSDHTGRVRTEKEVRIDLLEKKPDTVCFLMDAPLDLKNIWDAPSLGQVDKVSLWYDDYFRSPKTLAHPETWVEWQKTYGVRVGIWDGYWRCQWKKLTGCEAFPIHLAADPRVLRPSGEPLHGEWNERAAFVGTIPSRDSLNEVAEAFPTHVRHFLDEVCAAMRESQWPIKPYETAHTCRSFLAIKYGRAIDAMLNDPSALALWNHLLWRWGKRIARMRGLAAVAKAGPIAVLSGHNTEAYAGEEELRAALPGADLVYADTRAVPASSWKRLFRTGKFQVQITDPQSIEGGLPFRVFECGACAVPLLSDQRPELEALFPAGSGLHLANDEKGMQEKAAQLFKMGRRELDREGRHLHQAFRAQHTWELRWRQLTEGRELRSQATPYTPVSYRPATPEKPLVPQPA